MLDSELRGGSSRLCQLMVDHLAPVNKIELCTDACMRDLWGLTNLVASTVAEFNDTPLYFTDDIGIMFRPPTDYPLRFSCERRH
jgi:hypothetical protein